jgi:hypothetical protein
MPEPENTTENTEVVEEDSSATDELGEAGKKALAEERKARRALEKQLKEATDAAKAAQGQIQQFEDRDKTEAQKTAERIAELEKLLADKDSELSRKDQDILRRDIAKDKGVPVNLVTGSSREEMETAAERCSRVARRQSREEAGWCAQIWRIRGHQHRSEKASSGSPSGSEPSITRQPRLPNVVVGSRP